MLFRSKRINRGGYFGSSFAPSLEAPRGSYEARVVTAAASEADSPWRIGQNVVHPKFGAGVIVNAEGRGSDARVQVNFHRNGTKWLALEYAKLTAA